MTTTIKHEVTNGKRAVIKLADFCKTNAVWLIVSAIVINFFFVSTLVFYFENKTQDHNISSFGDALWWGIVTLATVGYGDRYPVTTEGRLLAVILILSGALALTVITGKISSVLLERTLLKGRGFVDKQKLSNHIIICGWRPDMAEFLGKIRIYNPDLKPEQIVLVANIPDQTQDNLRADPKLKGINIINGQYYQATVLSRAAPEKAQKVIILADCSMGSDGKPLNSNEQDARTIMTAITLSSIAKHTLVTAEIINPTMDSYLQMANVTEIIYSGQCDSQLLVLGSSYKSAGVANVVHDLLDPKKPGNIVTELVHHEHSQLTYKQFKSDYEAQHKNVTVIGILENCGNQHRMKELALKEAQKTADVKNLINNLQKVKDLRCNMPLFNPDDDYVIPQGAAAIIIERNKHLSLEEFTKQAA